MHYLLMYDLADDYLERRPEHRSDHLALAWAAAERGELLLAGAIAEPLDEALLLFQGESPAAAEAFARADPYVKAGLVKAWRVRPWQTVVGEKAANPVR
ncbi:YciI-like protein [Paraburkholderia tagetis]|uniref:YciI family protein n=1 Tax=Paraburkholderia tagetis TaxID=2913261 RepID=A0A9X1RJZ5_9BURK|nr:YciI-like protein [Paraburkholderia tagetis]MCG5073711.1 YciI family protein [Paraburkholderia tagetis]